MAGDLDRARAIASRYEAVASTDADTKLSRASLRAGIAALEGRRHDAGAAGAETSLGVAAAPVAGTSAGAGAGSVAVDASAVQS